MSGGEQCAGSDPNAVRIATYREIADRFGLNSVDAARVRVRRAGWQREPANHPLDPAHVRVPLSVWEQATIPPPPSRTRIGPNSGENNGGRAWARSPPNSPRRPDPNKLLADAVTTLREQLGRERERADTAEGRAAAERADRERERQRAEQLEQERDRLRIELEAWTAGGPLARAWRALLNRRVHP